MLRERIILACIYRSPNSSPDNSNNIDKFLEIFSRRFSLNLLVVGDFNHPNIDWEHSSTTSSPPPPPPPPPPCARDCFFEQFISEPTRGRGLSQPTLIDLVLTSNQELLTKLSLTHH